MSSVMKAQKRREDRRDKIALMLSVKITTMTGYFRMNSIMLSLSWHETDTRDRNEHHLATKSK